MYVPNSLGIERDDSVVTMLLWLEGFCCVWLFPLPFRDGPRWFGGLLEGFVVPSLEL